MATHQGKSQKAPRTPKPTRQVNTALITTLLATLPPLILAIVELIKTGHSLGWW
jgi:hypothetical protein